MEELSSCVDPTERAKSTTHNKTQSYPSPETLETKKKKKKKRILRGVRKMSILVFAALDTYTPKTSKVHMYIPLPIRLMWISA